jgi:hypothetical protein
MPSVFTDANEDGFGSGSDNRQPTITYAQAMQTMGVLNALGVYGEVFENQEGPFADYVLPDTSSTNERLYVLFYNGNYRDLAAITVLLDKNPKTEAVKRLNDELGIYSSSLMNIPSVRAAIETELKKLFNS